MASSKTTTDHAEIKRWVEQRGGAPACVRGTGDGGDVGMLRVDFPDGPEDKLEQISWDEWFEKFEEANLAFLYQDEDGSYFNKLVSRETADTNS